MNLMQCGVMSHNSCIIYTSCIFKCVTSVIPNYCVAIVWQCALTSLRVMWISVSIKGARRSFPGSWIEFGWLFYSVYIFYYFLVVHEKAVGYQLRRHWFKPRQGQFLSKPKLILESKSCYLNGNINIWITLDNVLASVFVAQPIVVSGVTHKVNVKEINYHKVTC